VTPEIKDIPETLSRSHYACWRKQGQVVAPIVLEGNPPEKALKLMTSREAKAPKKASKRNT
jgi:hypothetical protein